MNSKFTSTIAGASIFIAFISLLVKGLGFFREMIFAGYFGTSEEFDLYLIGAVLPITIDTVLIYVGQNYFIPIFNSYIKEGNTRTKDFVFKIFLRFITAGFILAVLLFLAANPLLRFYSGSISSSNFETIYPVFIVFICTIPFAAGTSILSAYLQSILEFKFPSIARVFLNTSIIVFVLLFTDKLGVLVIAIGYFVGTLLQMVFLIFKSKLRLPENVFALLKEKNTLRAGFKYSIVTTVLIEVISQLYLLFDRYFYNEVSVGGIAALNYAIALFVFPIGIFSTALATAIFPKISSSINDNNNRLRSLFMDSLLVILFLFIPISFIFIFFSADVVAIIFQRGNFDQMSTQFTASALSIYSISLVFFAGYGVINKIFYSLGLTKILLAITITGSIIKLVFNFILVGSLEHNGLALATTITYLYFFIFTFSVINVKMKLGITGEFLYNLFILIINALFSYLTASIVVGLLEYYDNVINFIQIFLFIILFIFNLNWVKHPSIKLFINIYNRTKEKSLQTQG